ncbi:MAG: hypothetical protein KDE27_26170 [Planctomycetes bacterium]|nr:hypothetical protein [Planctomycetota bacterium]
MRYLAALLLCAVARGQNVFHVGSGGSYAQIHQALAVAVAGDVIVVAPGIYEAFTMTAGVTLRQAQTNEPSVISSSPVVIDVPAGQQAYVFGLRFYTSTVVRRGQVGFERCSFEGFPTTLAIDAAAEVVMVQSQVIGGVSAAAGARVRGRLAATFCSFAGGPWWVTAGGPGLVVEGGGLHATRCTFTGGDVSFGSAAAHDALVVQAGNAWLADCTITGGSSPAGPGGAGIRNLTSQPVATARTTAQAGAGVPAGAAVVGPSAAEPLLGVLGPVNGIRRGAQYGFLVYGVPGTPVFMLFSTAARGAAHPALAQPAWLGAGADLWTMVPVDPLGSALFVSTVPNVPALLDARVFFHPLGIDANSRVQVAPPSGCLVQ